jgi:hypothetical protein
VAKLTGGRLISNINKQAPMLGALLQSMIDAHNHVASQAGIDPVGQSSNDARKNVLFGSAYRPEFYNAEDRFTAWLDKGFSGKSSDAE